MSEVSAADGGGPVLITGGAGFVGTNLAHRLAGDGRSVLVYDNLSRAGVERNLAWLKATHGDRILVEIADLRDAERLGRAVARTSQVFHFAAQVAVTTSLVDPFADFEVNARGTINLLEAARACAAPPPVFFTSTNKVYGDLEDLRIEQHETRYAATGRHAGGIDESRCLDFHSPYGCSKGTADQYVRDYARSYGLATVVFRMSCIYGPHQFGTEDQGWVAHFLLRALRREPITIYGDGLQVRDVLWVEDLVDAFLAASRRLDRCRGEAFNIGGGPANAASLIEILDAIGEIGGADPKLAFGGWRTGDQRFYVSDHGKFTRATGWRPKVSVAAGVRMLHRWLAEHRVGARLAPAKERAAAAAAVPAWT
jgi:CDP-paratose 2-epimerase